MYLGRLLPVAVLVAAIPAMISPVQPWLVLLACEAALGALVILDVLVAPSPSRLQLRRRAPSVLRLRRSAEVVLEAHNPSARRLEVALHDATPPSLQRAPVRHRTWLAPGAWAGLRAEVTPSRRGELGVGPITVRTGGPLRLAGRQSTLQIPQTLRVYPALPGRAEVELTIRRGRLLKAGIRSSAFRGGGSYFDSLREYLPDDELRRINWRATARATKAIANQYREERDQQVILLLDASRAMAGQIQGASRMEHALDAAIAVAELGSRVGDHVGVMAFGREVRAQIDPRGSRDQPHRIIDLLFGLEPALEAPNYRGAFAALLRRHRRRALMILFTDLAEASVLEPLLEALPVLLSRHLVLVVAVRDPEVESLAGAVPSTSEEAYEKAAASAFLAWRDSSADRLRRMGAATFDLHPARLAGRVADEYLRIKALGRL
jgi:uncharacterized protein (DUF58 family)